MRDEFREMKDAKISHLFMDQENLTHTTEILQSRDANFVTQPAPTPTMASLFSWSPFSRSSTPGNESESIELRYGKHAWELNFPAGSIPTMTVAELKKVAKEETRLKGDAEIKLLFQGKRLDDKEQLGKYNIKDGSRILMTAHTKKLEKPDALKTESATATATPSPAPSSTSESTATTSKVKGQGEKKNEVVAPQTPLEKIAALRQSIKSIYGPQITKFVKTPPSTQKERLETKARLNEMLLQQLLKFDNVIIDPDDYASNEARLERKAAVKWVQGLMEQIDGVDVEVAQS